jgi:hypothetical protein
MDGPVKGVKIQTETLPRSETHGRLRQKEYEGARAFPRTRCSAQPPKGVNALMNKALRRERSCGPLLRPKRPGRGAESAAANTKG